MTSSRYKGISWHKGIQKFVVQVRHGTQKVYKAFKEERDGVHFLMKLNRLPEARFYAIMKARCVTSRPTEG